MEFSFLLALLIRQHKATKREIGSLPYSAPYLNKKSDPRMHKNPYSHSKQLSRLRFLCRASTNVRTFVCKGLIKVATKLDVRKQLLVNLALFFDLLHSFGLAKSVQAQVIWCRARMESSTKLMVPRRSSIP